jgi:RNA-directed DNA polymerase
MDMWTTQERCPHAHSLNNALGVRGELRNMAGSGHGPWHLAQSKALSVGLSNAHFKSLGLPFLIEAR